MSSGDWKADRRRHTSRWALIEQPSLWAIAVYRFGRWIYGAPPLLRPPLRVAYFVAYSIVRLMTGIDIPRSVQIGPGLLIHHFGGIIVHPRAQIGRNCELRHGVTIGARSTAGPPHIGHDVKIGAYAQVLGNFVVGDGSTIGAMAVVLADVRPGSTVVGVPARQIRTSDVA